MCHTLVSREEVQRAETSELIDKMYGGSPNGLFAALPGRNHLSDKQIERLKRIVDEME